MVTRCQPDFAVVTSRPAAPTRVAAKSHVVGLRSQSEKMKYAKRDMAETSKASRVPRLFLGGIYSSRVSSVSVATANGPDLTFLVSSSWSMSHGPKRRSPFCVSKLGNRAI